MNHYKDSEPRSNNMVMSIKSKFESKENSENEHDQTEQQRTKTLPSLSRQLSDPVKVKRTPAFRSDQKPFQRGQTNATSYREKKTVLKVSDKPSNVHLLKKHFDSKDDLPNRRIIPKALNERSNSSAEIILNKVSNNHKDYVNIAALYTEPIPKSQRTNIHNMTTLKISDKSYKTDVQNVHNVQNAKISDDINYKLEALTDTLRSALKKPLPPGPAPQKPPRTFMHQSSSTSTSPIASQTNSPVMLNNSRKDFAAKLNVNLQKSLTLKSNTSASNINNVNSIKVNNNNNHSSRSHNSRSSNNNNNSISKPDPKYMLEKLENALKTNRIKKNVRSSSSDGRRLDNVNAQTSRSKLNLNCLHSLNCTNNTYQRLPELKLDNGKQDNKHDEPVYAEPFAFLKASTPEKFTEFTDVTLRGSISERDSKTNRNSLYYMSTPIGTESTPLLNQGDVAQPLDVPRKPNQLQTDDDVVMCDTPSSSSRSSLDEPPLKIKDLIKSFEESAGSSPPSPSVHPPTDRVEKLEKQLRRTLEQSFNDSEGTGGTIGTNQNNNNNGDDKKQDEAILGKFETYVRTIKMITQSRQKFQQRQMFDCCMLVTLCDKMPYIKFKYPPNAKLPNSIENLVFPDSNCFDSGPKAQCYSIVITNDKGQRIYGYCRRVLPEDSQNCLPLAYCILSSNRAQRFYNRILEEIEKRHGIPDKDRNILLHEFYGKSFPNPGEKVTFPLTFSEEHPTQHYALVNNGVRNGNLSNHDMKDNKNEVEIVEIMLHQDSRHKENDLEELCQCLEDTNLLLKVFASLLLERKVILLSRQLGRLSTCMEALQNILYPFSWPHTLIPVVPRNLWEIVEAPTPLICGVLSNNVVNEHEINDAIVIDLDNGRLLQQVGDEMSILPRCLIKEFKDGLALAKVNRNSPNKEKRSIYNVLLSDAFLRIFVHSCGHYKDYLTTNSSNERSVFDLVGYVQHPKKKTIQRFLKWFTQTSMFATFIDNIEADKNYYKIFESRTKIYRAQDATAILEKMKEWRRD